jgi:hypothetical protein
MHTPMPARGPGIASLPRSRAELGPFVALASGGRFAAVQGGFQPDLGGTNIDAELHLALRGGVGLESILGEKGDGLVYAEIGMSVHREAPSGAFFEDDQYYSTSRSAFTFRWRAPFYVISGDLLIAGPVLAVVSPKTLKTMALEAADGGVIPWQRPIPTRAGRFQFILGREVGVTFFGYLGTGADRFAIAVPTAPGEPEVVQELNIRSIEWEFPILEYRALRSFASRQAYAVVFQFGAGFDKPMEVEVIGASDAPAPDLDTRYFAFARMSFDVRRHL